MMILTYQTRVKKTLWLLVSIIILILLCNYVYHRSTAPENVPLVIIGSEESELDEVAIVEPAFSLSSNGQYAVTIKQTTDIFRIEVFDRYNEGTKTLDKSKMGSQPIPGFVLFTPDNKQIIAGGTTDGSQAGAIGLWDVTSGKLVRTITMENVYGPAVALSSDGRTLIYNGGRKGIKFFDINEGKVLGSIAPPREGILQSISLSKDGNNLVAIYSHKSKIGFLSQIFMFDVATRKILWCNCNSSNDTYLNLNARCIELSPDGKTLALAGRSTGNTQQLGFFDSRSGQLIRWISRFEKGNVHSTSSQLVNFSPDGKLLAWGGSQVEIWNVNDGSLRKRLQGTGGVIFSSDGSYLSSRSLDIPQSRAFDWQDDEPDRTERDIILWKSF